MKTAGILITALILALTGNYLAVLTEKRIKTLECIVLMIKSIKTQISSARIPLTDIIDNLLASGQFDNLSFLTAVKSDISNGESFQKSWEKALKSFAGINGLTKEDTALIIRFGENLGSSDTNGQTENCNTFIEMLSAEIQHLKSKAQSKVKIYNSMGVLSAALVIILLS